MVGCLILLDDNYLVLGVQCAAIFLAGLANLCLPFGFLHQAWVGPIITSHL